MSSKKPIKRVVEEMYTHLRILSRTTAASVSDYHDINEFLDEIVSIICDELGYEHFGIGLVDDEERIVYRAGCGMTEDVAVGLAVAPGEGIVGWVFQNGKPLLAPDVRREPRYLKKRMTTVSELCVPLRTRKRIIGVINAESDRLGQFTSCDLDLLTTLANIVSGNIERILGSSTAGERERLKLESLTPREREVLLKLTAGKSNKAIARELKIKENTVEAHLGRIFLKMGVQSRTEAMVWVEKQGILGGSHP